MQQQNVESVFLAVNGYQTDRIFLLESMDLNFDGCVNIITNRFNSIFSSPMSIITSFKIMNTVHFYKCVISNVVGDSKFAQCLGEYNMIYQDCLLIPSLNLMMH